MSREQIESTDWLTRDVPKEQIEREKQEAIMSADIACCHTEFADGNGNIYTDYDVTAQKMVAKGYRKQVEGEWVDQYHGKYANQLYKCSVCGETAFNDGERWFLTQYCPNCCAKMKGGEG